MVDLRRIQRPPQRAVHHIIPLGTILAAHVLHRADVAAPNDYVGGVVIAGQDRAEVRALRVAREFSSVIRCAGQQYRRAPGALRRNNDGMQFHAVTHWDHHVALAVIEAVVGWFELFWRFARQAGGLFLLIFRLGLGFFSLLLIGDLSLREGFANP